MLLVVLNGLINQAEQTLEQEQGGSDHRGVPPNKYSISAVGGKNILSTVRSTFVISSTSRKRSIVPGIMASGKS